MSLRVWLLATDPVRRHGLSTMLAEAGHVVVAATADVVLCDSGAGVPEEAEAPVLILTDRMPADPPAGVLPRGARLEQLDAALRAVAAG